MLTLICRNAKGLKALWHEDSFLGKSPRRHKATCGHRCITRFRRCLSVWTQRVWLPARRNVTVAEHASARKSHGALLKTLSIRLEPPKVTSCPLLPSAREVLGERLHLPFGHRRRVDERVQGRHEYHVLRDCALRVAGTRSPSIKPSGLILFGFPRSGSSERHNGSAR
jgi:hypothetical protein